MKILFLINHLADGGAERVAATLINHLCEYHELVTVTFSNKKDSFPLDQSITRVKIIVNGNNKFIRAIKKIRRIRKEIKRENPDITISFMTYTNIYTLIAKIGLKRKIIVSERSSLNRTYPFYIRIMRKLTYPASTKVVLVTKADKEKLNHWNNCTTIYNPSTFSIFTNYLNREKTIIATSSSNRWRIKGLDILIKAWAKISHQNPDWNLEILGRFNANDIPVEIQQLPQERVSWLDWRNNIEEVLRKKSIFVLASRFEGCPNSLIEAMSQGCACIVTDCDGGPKEIVEDGLDGLIAQNENADDIAAKMQNLIIDENLRKRLSAKATLKAKLFDKEFFFAKWDNLIEEVSAK